MASTDRVEASCYEREDGAYRCGLCPHRCRIAPGQYGRCGSRRGDKDMLVACTYGKVSSLCIDPVEKKPLYHWRPGTGCFSVGSVGCNMSCRHCQNYAISMLPSEKRTAFMSPRELAAMCRSEGQDAIAFTYNEPAIWLEYIRDVMAADPGLKLILVTNGLVSKEPLLELCALADAMNIDVKGFTDEFYTKVCGARLADVLESAKTVAEQGVHLELTYLAIPGFNDSEDEVRRFCAWVRDELGEDVPVHFTRFHPDYRMTDVQPTPLETVLRCREIGMECGLHYVYAGNALTEDAGGTFCPECGTAVIRRLGYLTDIVCLDGDRCGACGHRLPIVLRRDARYRGNRNIFQPMTSWIMHPMAGRWHHLHRMRLLRPRT